MPINCKILAMLVLALFLPGCMGFGLPRWKAGQYTLREIMREYEKGTYKETFSSLRYEEKINICVASFTRVHPPVLSIIEIFEGEDNDTANRVMEEILEDINNNDSYMTWMKILIWEVIVGENREEYSFDRVKILNALMQHEQSGKGYWKDCIDNIRY